MGCFSEKSGLFPVVVSQASGEEVLVLPSHDGMGNPRKEKVSSLNLSQEKCRLSCFHSGRQENTIHTYQILGSTQSP